MGLSNLYKEENEDRSTFVYVRNMSVIFFVCHKQYIEPIESRKKGIICPVLTNVLVLTCMLFCLHPV